MYLYMCICISDVSMRSCILYTHAEYFCYYHRVKVNVDTFQCREHSIVSMSICYHDYEDIVACLFQYVWNYPAGARSDIPLSAHVYIM